jgi:hypothetical protein
MQSFFKALDSLVAAVMGFESLISLNALKSILDRSQKENS